MSLGLKNLVYFWLCFLLYLYHSHKLCPGYPARRWGTHRPSQAVPVFLAKSVLDQSRPANCLKQDQFLPRSREPTQHTSPDKRALMFPKYVSRFCACLLHNIVLEIHNWYRKIVVSQVWRILSVTLRNLNVCLWNGKPEGSSKERNMT